MVGVSGAGKSTIVQELLKHHLNTYTFSLDSCRMDFFDKIDNDMKKTYAEAFKYANMNQTAFDSYVTRAWKHGLMNFETIIVDNTNLTKKARGRWVNEARAHGFTIVAIQVMTPLAVVLERQMTRCDKHVPEEIVRDMYFRQQEVLAGSEADFVMNVDGTASQLTMIGSLHLG
jgi:predicted kinase